MLDNSPIESKPIETLGDALPKEIARVRDQVMPRYIVIGESGEPALVMMRAAMDRAMKATAKQDAVEMMIALQDLREFKV